MTDNNVSLPFKKRKHDLDECEQNGPSKCGITNKITKFDSDSNVASVAEHYNKIQQSDINMRKESDLFHLRAFNNWLKSVLIDVSIKQILRTNAATHRKAINVIDLACGKGGDLNKWQHANIGRMYGVDVASVSIEQAQGRYNSLLNRNRNKEIFKASFHLADMTRQSLRSVLSLPPTSIHLVTCQFAFHYCFESEKQAHFLMKSVSDCLVKDGMFVGTTPNSARVLSLLRENKGNWSNGNCVLTCDLDSALLDETTEPPMFGANYKFTLGEQVIDCTEYLVHTKVLSALGDQYGLEMLSADSFADFYRTHSLNIEYHNLLSRMSALEPVPAHQGHQAKGAQKEYIRARQLHLEHKKTIGTLRQTESEIAQLYRTFIFVKR